MLAWSGLDRYNLFEALGEVAERSNATVLKTVDPRGSVGSNPTLSAMFQPFVRRIFPSSPIRKPMAARTPQEAFEQAQQAMQRGDWRALFSILDPCDVRRILNNAFKLCLTTHHGAHDEFAAIFERHGVPAAELARLWQSWSKTVGPNPTHEKTLKAMIKRASDIAGLAAELERHSRAIRGGGSVSSSLFLGETLSDLVVTADQARALRQFPSGWLEPVEFVRDRDGWKVRLFARARRT